MTGDKHTFLPQHGHYRKLRVYQVATVLYDLTYTFCKRFLPAYGDRTVDQMVQAARSGKQNIAEGNQAAAHSAETEIKLTGVAKSSIEELLADFEDYLRTRHLTLWDKTHPRFEKMRQWTTRQDFMQQYAKKTEKMNDEKLANLCATLCHQTIYMLNKLLETQQNRFVTEGGIKEQMYAARTGYRQAEQEELQALRDETKRLREETKTLREEISRLKSLLETNGIES